MGTGDRKEVLTWPLIISHLPYLFSAVYFNFNFILVQLSFYIIRLFTGVELIIFLILILILILNLFLFLLLFIFSFILLLLFIFNFFFLLQVISLWENMVKQRILPTQAAAAELFKACEMEGSGIIALGALKWLWALNPSFPSTESPVSTIQDPNGECCLFLGFILGFLLVMVPTCLYDW